MGHTWAHMCEHGLHVNWKFFELSHYGKKKNLQMILQFNFLIAHDTYNPLYLYILSVNE
jgi:hypothetical protein